MSAQPQVVPTNGASINPDQQLGGASGSWDDSTSQGPVVHFPHPDPDKSMTVAFPASMSMDAIESAAKNIYHKHVAPVVSTWNREVQSANHSLVNVPRTLASSITQPVTDEERATLGVSNKPSFLEQIGRAS